MPPTHPYLATRHPRVVAHRGLHRGGGGQHTAGENTVAAFAAAVALGCEHVETDAHASADGVAVLHHDARLDRTTSATGPLARRTAAELRAVRVTGGGPVPTLLEALTALPRTRFTVDLKSDAAVPAVLAAVAAADAWDRVCLASFATRRLHRARRDATGPVCTALSPAGVGLLRARAVSLLDLPARPRPAGWCVQVPVGPRLARLVDRRLVAEAHRLGLEVHPWTVDDPAEMARLLDLGVDGLITDRPDLALAAVAGRGDWPA